jgi:hypothetical protein
MPHSRFSRFLLAPTVLAAILLFTPGANAQWTGKAVSFNGNDGLYPYASLISDGAGNLYGTTTEGGGHGSPCPQGGCGVVFELMRGSNGPVTRKVLHRFTGGTKGAVPYAGLVLDSAGNLYGTANHGGRGGSRCPARLGCGLVFELSPRANGQWTYIVLHTFRGGSDGANPYSGLTMDGAGNPYGVTDQGGSGGCDCGAVFELTPGAKGNGPRRCCIASPAARAEAIRSPG